jgi:hypothetical protein
MAGRCQEVCGLLFVVCCSSCATYIIYTPSLYVKTNHQTELILIFLYSYILSDPSHKLRHQPVKVMCSLFACYGIAAMPVKAAAYAFLHCLHHFLVFHFYSIQV